MGSRNLDVPRGGLWALKVAHRAMKVLGLCKSHFPYSQSPPEARMASCQSDFFDFLGLFAQL